MKVHNIMSENYFIERKPSFVLHKDSLDILCDLDDEQAGKLFKAIASFQKSGEEPKDQLCKMLFLPFKNQFIRDNEKWLKTSKNRANSGSKGGKQKQANASKSKQDLAKVADSVSVSVSVNESVSDNESEKEVNKEDKSSEFVNEIFTHWLTVMNKGSNTKKTNERVRVIKARLNNYSVDDIKTAITNCSKNQFNMDNGHNDLTLICRNDTKLEYYRDMVIGLPNQPNFTTLDQARDLLNDS